LRNIRKNAIMYMWIMKFFRVCGWKSMPAAGETTHVNRQKYRWAWCGLEVSPARG